MTAAPLIVLLVLGTAAATTELLAGQASSLTNWTKRCGNPALCPIYSVVAGTANNRGTSSLVSSGNGRARVFGYIETPTLVPLTVGRTYCLEVGLTFQDLPSPVDLQRHVRVEFLGPSYLSGIQDWARAGTNGATGLRRFVYGWPDPMAPYSNSSKATVRLYYKFAAGGKVTWNRVSLQECAPEAPRKPVRVAAAWWNDQMARNATLPYWAAWLDLAGAAKVDLAVLPESMNGCHGADALGCVEALDGPTAQLMRQKAAQFGMFVMGNFYAWGTGKDKTGDVAFNSALLFDRGGELLGVHNKNILYDPEEDAGISPGEDSFPVFETELGKIGIMTCYESWFPESARILAYRGAELLLFPSAGFDPTLMPARAADNGVWVVASSGGVYANIWDSAGNEGGKPVNQYKDSGSSFLNYTRDKDAKMLVAELDLGFKWSPDWNGGDMSSGPGGRRARYTGIQDIEQEIHDEAHRWWN